MSVAAPPRTAGAKTALRVDGVTQVFQLPGGNEITILDDISLSVGSGEITSVMGRSGSGKSTLLSVMGLLSAPSSGTVFVRGENASALSDARRARLRNHALGFVFQNYSLVPTWTALQNCQMPLLYRRGLSPARARAAAVEELAALGLGDRLHSYPRELSGGEQQRIAIARALVRKPDVLLADEPTGALDEATAEVVLTALLGAVTAVGCSLVLVTHDAEVAARADARYLLTGGRLARTDGSSEVR